MIKFWLNFVENLEKSSRNKTFLASSSQICKCVVSRYPERLMNCLNVITLTKCFSVLKQQLPTEFSVEFREELREKLTTLNFFALFSQI